MIIKDNRGKEYQIQDLEEFKNSYNRFGYADINSLLKAIGTGVLTVREMFKKIRPKEDIDEKRLNLGLSGASVWLGVGGLRLGKWVEKG